MSDPPHPARSFNGDSRTVHLPLHELDACCRCGTTSGLRLCSSCGERVYCSMECQKLDWKDHKKICGKTDRIDLGNFWPFFAYMAELSRIHPSRPLHRALQHVIVNNPVPNTTSRVLPDGSATNVVLLGDSIPESQMGERAWWPTAPSESIRRKFFFRICREGFALPLVLSICVTLLAEMYTTTYDPTREDESKTTQDDGYNVPINNNHRFRLQCERSPIADFGICKGAAEVKSQDTLGYLYVDPANPGIIDFYKGQNPRDHYWIYFKTLKGEEFTLDLCMFTFNFAMLVAHGEPYYPSHPSYPPLTHLAGYFVDRELRRSTPVLQYEKQRFSVLRNKALHGVVRRAQFSQLDEKILTTVMERIAGRKTSEDEQNLLITWTSNNRDLLALNLAYKEYLTYPPVVPIGIDYDPGEKDEPREDDEDLLKYLKKWNRRHRKGTVTWEQLGAAFHRWDSLPPEMKTAHRRRKKE